MAQSSGWFFSIFHYSLLSFHLLFHHLLPNLLVFVLLPKQIAITPKILRGATDNVFTVINCETHAVVLHSPS